MFHQEILKTVPQICEITTHKWCKLTCSMHFLWNINTFRFWAPDQYPVLGKKQEKRLQALSRWVKSLCWSLMIQGNLLTSTIANTLGKDLMHSLPLSLSQASMKYKKQVCILQVVRLLNCSKQEKEFIVGSICFCFSTTLSAQIRILSWLSLLRKISSERLAADYAYYQKTKWNYIKIKLLFHRTKMA